MKAAVTGTVFDIKEMALFDGPGLRTTVFLKGCPMRCAWCHNPEGLDPAPELMVTRHGCTDCGACRQACAYPDGCRLCGECVRACPLRLRKLCGQRSTPRELAERLRRDAGYLSSVGGGVTFSGGEPLMQSEFLTAVLDLLPDVHKVVETGGYAGPGVFRSVVERLDYVIMDIKLADEAEHKRWTGVSNRPILENLRYLKTGIRPFTIRIPLIPGVSDTRENLSATAELLRDTGKLDRVELLPYHRTAGAKYATVGRAYQPGFDTEAEPETGIELFSRYGIDCRVL